MKKYRKVMLPFIIISAIFQTGCWDSKALENLNIPIAAGYEIVENTVTNKREMEVYSVIPVFYKKAPEKYIVDITRGDLTGKTRVKRMNHLSEKLSLGSFQIAILGNELSKKGAGDVLDILTRTPEMKSTIPIAIADCDIKDIFQFAPDNYPNVGIYLDALFENAFKKSYIPVSDVYHFNLALNTKGWHAIAPMIRVQGNKIVINKYGIFKEDKMVYDITIPETQILYLLSGNPSMGIWTYDVVLDGLPCTVSVEMNNKTKITVKKEEGTYRIYLIINCKGKIVEIVPNENLESMDKFDEGKLDKFKKEELLKDIEKGYKNYIKSNAKALINKAQNEFEMDIFNWVKFAQAKWRKDIDDLNWDECFTKADIVIDINATINLVGEKI